MGWCSGTPIFDAMFEVVVDEQLPEAQAYNIIYALFAAMEHHDWDCQWDSAYCEHPLFMQVMKQLHPDYDWDYDEDGDA